MKNDYIYSRVLLKLSGEALKGNSNDSPYCAKAINSLVEKLGTVIDNGIELAIVVGGGNIWRGAKAEDRSLQRTSADYIGMLATVMNALYLRDAFNSTGFSAVVQSAIPMPPIAVPFDGEKASRHLEEGKVVIFAAGTGHPFFTTDTCAALRAIEIGAEALLKATKVDGVYDSDPMKNRSAKKFDEITYDDALAKNLQIMDMTAFSLCKENSLPIIVFNFSDAHSLELVLQGNTQSATIVKTKAEN